MVIPAGALSVVLPPAQKVELPLMLAEGVSLTVIVVVVTSAHWVPFGVKVSVIGPDNPLASKLLPVTPEPLQVPAMPPCVVLSVIADALAQMADKGVKATGLLALTVIVNVCGVPVQVGEVPAVGVTVMVAVMGVEPVLVAVKDEIFPEPLAPKPMAVLLLVQLKLAPAEPLKAGMVTDAPSQIVWLAGAVAVGNGLTVIVNVWAVPGHPATVGVTVIVAVTGDAVALVAVNAPMLPVPLAAKPMAVLLFVQLKVGLPVPVKLTAVVVAPAQTVWLVGAVTVGRDVTVTWCVSDAVHPPLPVTVTV